MKLCQVLDEIENIVDRKQQYDTLLSRSQANEVERQRIEGAECESLYATAAQGNKYSSTTSQASKD